MPKPGEILLSIQKKTLSISFRWFFSKSSSPVVNLDATLTFVPSRMACISLWRFPTVHDPRVLFFMGVNHLEKKNKTKNRIYILSQEILNVQWPNFCKNWLYYDTFGIRFEICFTSWYCEIYFPFEEYYKGHIGLQWKILIIYFFSMILIIKQNNACILLRYYGNPANTRLWHNVVLILCRRRRWQTNIKTTLVFAGNI